MGDPSFLPMKVTGLTIDPFSNMPIVILKNEEGNIAVPIWIGLIEAAAIATELEHIQFSRPMTHDLFHTTLDTFNIRLSKIEIHDLADNTFFARIVMEASDGKSTTLDSRPSDALALALRTKSPILVSREVIEKCRTIDMAKRYDENSSEEQTWAEILENLSPEDFGKYKM